MSLVHTPLSENVGPTGHSLLPGGFGRSLMAVGPWSPSAVSGDGYWLTTDEGARLIDANNNFTTLIHGHAHPEVVKATAEALKDGFSFGLPNARETDFAAQLLRRMDGMDTVRFTNSGTEAIMTAVRMARARTGRSAGLMVSGSYHGASESVLSATGEKFARGIPQSLLDDIVLVPPNDPEAVEAAFKAQEGGFAFALIDYMPTRATMQPVTERFAATVRMLCTETGTAMIADEVINFRAAPGGLCSTYDSRPDMVGLGKMVGGGLPVGAVVGLSEWMDELNPLRSDGLSHGGTTSANPVCMVAGAETLRLYDEPSIDRLNGMGDVARLELIDRLAGTGWSARGQGSMFRMWPPVAASDQKAAHLALWWACLDDGVLLSQHGVAALSTPMDETVIEKVVETIHAAVDRSGVTA